MIGIIGQGFVGNAVYQKFKNYYDVKTYDIDESKCNSTFEDTVKNSKYIFVCLPTPMYKQNGSCNTSIVEEVANEIDVIAEETDETKYIIIKSTITPGTTKRLNSDLSYTHTIFNPEFLTEANSITDYENQQRIILGGSREHTSEIKPIFVKVFPMTHIIRCDSMEAEMVKYTTNTFLATKVSFANEIYEICKTHAIDYDKVIEYATMDERLGKSHWAVPGPDGDFGFGGHCFPKDLEALLFISKYQKTTNNVLKAAKETNDKVRKNRDWEDMDGRAVS